MLKLTHHALHDIHALAAFDRYGFLLSLGQMQGWQGTAFQSGNEKGYLSETCAVAKSLAYDQRSYASIRHAL